LSVTDSFAKPFLSILDGSKLFSELSMEYLLGINKLFKSIMHLIFPGSTMDIFSRLIDRQTRMMAMASNFDLGRCSGRKTVSLTAIKMRNQHKYPTTKFSHPGNVGKTPMQHFVTHSIVGLNMTTPLNAHINI
jgi:hypothetical protein